MKFKVGEQVYFVDYSDGPVPVPVPAIVIEVNPWTETFGIKTDVSEYYVWGDKLFSSYKKALEAAIVKCTTRLNEAQEKLDMHAKSFNELTTLYESTKE